MTALDGGIDLLASSGEPAEEEAAAAADQSEDPSPPREEPASRTAMGDAKTQLAILQLLDTA